MKKLFYTSKICLFFLIILNYIKEFSTQNLNKCTYDDIGKLITPCKDSKRKGIHIYLIEK